MKSWIVHCAGRTIVLTAELNFIPARAAETINLHKRARMKTK